jgi:hypothetical protein
MLKAKGLRYCSWSGVMFDGLAHGLSFVATNCFFKEFSSKRLARQVTDLLSVCKA